MPTTPGVVDLFAGSGGLSLGLTRAGLRVVAAFENWQPALDTYRANFDHPAEALDLSDVGAAVTAIGAYSPTVIVGGPPCQDFSSAGNRSESHRADLTVAFARIVEESGPAYFVMENVARAQGSAAYAEAREIFQAAGYGLTEVVLDASFCGVPQRRKRFFCLGALGLSDDWARDAVLANLASDPMTMRQYFGQELDFQDYYRHPRNYSRRAVFSVDEPAPTIRGVSRPVPPGYPGHRRDSAPVTPDLRPLSTFWRSRLQTFPVDFQWTGSKTEIEQMIGNAVPVGLGEFIGRALLEAAPELEACINISAGSPLAVAR